MSIQRDEAELNGTFHLLTNLNICSVVRIRKHALFDLCNNLYKDIFKKGKKRKKKESKKNKKN